ncbi:hypothetical protein [Natrialba sp. INN-245]|uniref:hypothetical protein n=1 Tax=Natrialba sp. INN-245 TaxID=2690967 RepID=UPI00130F9170|nr:hypothetical protein [Natrialba sp. INN-245]MWV38842.1 hypothetical protein [Natrialba sp. INN-245]
MINNQRGLLVRHLSEKELNQAIEAAQEADETRLVRRLCFIKNLYQHLSRKLREAGMNYAKPRPMDPRRPDDAEEALAERLDQALGENDPEKTEETKDEPVMFGFFSMKRGHNRSTTLSECGRLIGR